MTFTFFFNLASVRNYTTLHKNPEFNQVLSQIVQILLLLLSFRNSSGESPKIIVIFLDISPELFLKSIGNYLACKQNS